MNVTVIGCGRWGSFIAWYLDLIGHRVTLYGREGSANFHAIKTTRTNGTVTFRDSIALSSDLAGAVASAQIIVISVNSQGLRALMRELAPLITEQTLVLCMKGIETDTCLRLTQVTAEFLPQTPTAIWVGPGHVQEFVKGVPNCMVIDSADQALTHRLVDAFSGGLIRFYYGSDLIGNEIGAAAKNVIGIAAGVLDGLSLSSLKGALMSRAPREISRLIRAMGGNELSAYGLCHLGDYEATLFSPHSHNRCFGEMLVRGEAFDQLAEGSFTALAITQLAEKQGIDLPICSAVRDIIYHGVPPKEAVSRLFLRSLKDEFYEGESV